MQLVWLFDDGEGMDAARQSPLDGALVGWEEEARSGVAYADVNNKKKKQ